MPDPKKRQRFFDFMYENCLTVSMIHDAVQSLKNISVKPIEYKPGMYYSTYIIGPYADFLSFSEVTDKEWGELGTTAIDIETFDPIAIFKKEGEDESGKF
jgi:hypothetical protein